MDLSFNFNFSNSPIKSETKANNIFNNCFGSLENSFDLKNNESFDIFENCKQKDEELKSDVVTIYH